MAVAFGLDFGTTNSVFSIMGADGSVATVRFQAGADTFDVFRSVLFFDVEETGRSTSLNVSAGPWGIQDYLAFGEAGRLIQSMKTFLSSATFTDTQVFQRRLTLEELVSAFLGQLRRRVEAEIGPVGGRITVGRPVNFAGERPDNALAERRLSTALAQAGFDDVRFAYEPVAAAYDYGRRLTAAETILVADFGGGTTDFSLVELTPDRTAATGIRARILATGGVGIAGDSFDRRIVQEVVCPALGKDVPLLRDTPTPTLPRWLYAHLEQWHHLSLLKNPKTMKLLEELARQAVDPRPIEGLTHLVRANLGFALYRAVAAAKARLSADEETDFAFADGPVSISRTIRRAEFEAWIAPDLAEIADCLDRTLDTAGRDAGAVGRVFMTGGTSLVPAVRRIFAERFGADRLVSGDELVSVGRGLALIDRERAAIPV
ncbi:MAG TPA: Hsp70 family protein [Azospirillaceae bacterium]|nr:Hsp70 family protein [Azospirillaceae bacterium]